MKQGRLQTIYEWGLLAVVFLVVLHAPLVVGAGQLLPDFATPLKAWKEVGLTVLGAIGVALVTRRGMWQTVLRSRAIQLALAFILLHLFMALVFRGEYDRVVAGLMIDLRFIVMFILAYAMVLLRPASVRSIVRTVAAGAAVVLGFGLLQIILLPDDVLRSIGYSRDTITPYTTIDSNPDYVRINSTLRGPNPLGALMVLYGALALAFLAYCARAGSGSYRRMAAGGFGALASLAVLFASFSRSAYLAALAAGFIIAAVAMTISRKVVAAGAVAVVLLGASLWLLSSTDWYSNVILHEDPESTVLTKSNDGHIESFILGAERMVRQPFGAGIGSTGSASLYDTDTGNDTIIENYYFYVAHESGWLGFGLFLALSAVILFKLWERRRYWPALGTFAAGVGMGLIGILLPVWADETVALTWWALAGAIIALPRGIIEEDGGTTS